MSLLRDILAQLQNNTDKVERIDSPTNVDTSAKVTIISLVMVNNSN